MLRRNADRAGRTERRMSFFDRNRKELIEKGYDPARLPPGQYLTDRFPVLHVGDVPDYRRVSGTSGSTVSSIDHSRSISTS